MRRVIVIDAGRIIPSQPLSGPDAAKFPYEKLAGSLGHPAVWLARVIEELVLRPGLLRAHRDPVCQIGAVPLKS